MKYKVIESSIVPVRVGYTHRGSVVVYRKVIGKKRMETEDEWAEYGTIRYDGLEVLVFRYRTSDMSHPTSWRSIVSVVKIESPFRGIA